MELDRLFDKVIQTGRDLAAPKIVTVNGESQEVFRLFDPSDCSLVTHRKVPPARKHAVKSLESFIQLAKEAAFKGSQLTPPAHPAVWFSVDNVVLLYDDEDRFDRAVCELGISDQMDTLATMLGQGVGYDQKALIRLLRVSLHGCESATSDALLKEVKTVHWVKNADDTAAIEKTKASIGRSLLAKMVGADNVPEYVYFHAPVFANPYLAPAAATLKVAVDVDLEKQLFVLTLCPNEWEKAIKLGEDYLAHTLSSNLGPDVILHHGQP